jgi:hypothetical protein
MTPLKRKLTSQGLSIRAISLETGVHRAQVSAFVNNHPEKLGKVSKKLLRQHFIDWGFLPRPKPRPAPVCQRCGLEYPTRTQSKQQQSTPQA